MNFAVLLAQQGYASCEKTAVFMKPGYAGIAYSDGDETEGRIARIVANATDLSVFSRELAQECTDWPSLYHLGTNRANILRPFHALLQESSVLEIGAGCGAITRYLGESGARVLALEGSPRRAAIARSRTRDLDNVTVLAERFDRFEWEGRFDVITLIGVLEYAAMFTPGSDPARAMLTQARKLLKPGGRLVLAIENQLGLKYFAGAAEDHTGEPMLGIEGRYTAHGPRTFGRKKLNALLKSAGFINQQWLVPFPDYKWPVSIVTEAGLDCPDFDSAALAGQSARRDPQLPGYMVFAPELAWPVVDDNGLTLDLANSFLVVAGVEAPAETENLILAYHYSTSRREEFCKETLFIWQKHGEILIRNNPLGFKAQYRHEGKLIEFHIDKWSKYINGETLSSKIITSLAKNNWIIDDIQVHIEKYIHIVYSLMEKEQKCIDHKSIDTLLPGKFFDIIPQNIIIDANDDWHIIDQEWTVKERIPLGYVVFRALLPLLYQTTRFFKHDGFDFTQGGFLSYLFKIAKFSVTKGNIVAYDDLESVFQTEICGYNPHLPLAYDAPLPQLLAQSALNQRENQLSATQNQLSATQNQLSATQNQLSATQNQQYKNALELAVSQERLSDSVLELQRMGAVSWRATVLRDVNHNSPTSRKERLGSLLDRISRDKRNQLSLLQGLLEKIPLFDADHYRLQDMSLRQSNIDPVRHYFFQGASEGRNPSPYFFTSWYLAEYPDVAACGINPFLHFLLHGIEEGRNPNPYFFTRWYLENHPQLQKDNIHPLLHYIRQGNKEGAWPNPYFDPDWYSTTYLKEQNGREPLAHFLEQDPESGHNPNPYFDGTWYLQAYPWVRKMDIHPLQHHIQHGLKEKTNPNPYFDSDWYAKQYPESVQEGFCPLAHYLNNANNEGYNPNPFFDTHWYLTTYNDIRENKSPPLLHYILHGKDEKRNPSEYFATQWYLEKNPDVKRSGMHPFLHFIAFGVFENRDPGPHFNTSRYIDQYPEVLNSNLPPFLHYLQLGKQEGKIPYNLNDIELDDKQH